MNDQPTNNEDYVLVPKRKMKIERGEFLLGRRDV